MTTLLKIILPLFCPLLLNAQISTTAFRNPPQNFKPVPLWFWNNTTVDAAELRTQFRKMILTDGYGGCAILPFGSGFRPEYLSADYLARYDVIIEEAEKLGAKISLYDEYGFPSGSMGAINADGVPRFKNKYPDATLKRLDKIAYAAPQGSIFRQQLPTGKLMSVVALDTLKGSRINLRKQIRNGEINWKVPTGAWKVLCFVCVKDGDPNVDYLSAEAVKLFVKETHETYYQHAPHAFGKEIYQTFFDEPTLYRAQGRVWTADFNEQFIRHYGFSPELLYPALWYDIGADTPVARNYLFGFRAQLYAEGFMKTIQEWAAAHHIQSTGHQDQEEVLNPVSVSADLMLCGKYMDIPGIDKIGGGRPTEKFYKIIASSAYNWDKTHVMSETYGAMGNITVEELYTIAMQQYTKGINQLIPHAVWYDDQVVTFLPELSSRNPIYREALPAFNQFLSRLNYLLARESRHVADIAMIYPIESLQAEHYLDGTKGFYEGGVEIPNTDYAEVSTILTDSLGRDFTYLHPETIRKKCDIQGQTLVLNNKINREEYRVLIVPGMKTISWENLKKVEAFYRAGGRVIFTTQLPEQSTEFGRNKEVRKSIDRMLKASQQSQQGGKGRAKGVAFFVPKPSLQTLKQVINDCDMVFDVDFVNNQPLNYIHKVFKGQSIYYFANLNKTARNSQVVLRGKIIPIGLDPHTGAACKLRYTHQQSGGIETTSFQLPLKSQSSLFVVSDGAFE